LVFIKINDLKYWQFYAKGYLMAVLKVHDHGSPNIQIASSDI
jgi:hypothetical protein